MPLLADAQVADISDAVRPLRAADGSPARTTTPQLVDQVPHPELKRLRLLCPGVVLVQVVHMLGNPPEAALAEALAGGLRPDNVAQAIATVRPHGVDVCSGVRRAGRLDAAVLRAFMAAAAAGDQGS